VGVELRQLIQQGCEAQCVPVTQEVVDKLTAFVKLLSKWNRVYNLTSVRRPDEMVNRHIQDSLIVLPWITGPDLLDVGSGAGLPGLPLAMVKPELTVTCLDANAKKTRFIQQAVSELDLQNVRVEHQRVEKYRPEAQFHQVISRAFSSLQQMQESAGHLCLSNGELLAMKGANPVEELSVLRNMGYAPQVSVLQVPGLDAQRHLVRWMPSGAIKKA
jgi:16S rRNA (guanine527-N7)-methyltransferase